MIRVNLKAVAGILGGTATVAALITGAVKHFRNEDDTDREDNLPEQECGIAESRSCSDSLSESFTAINETSTVADSIPSDAEVDTPCCTSCIHSTCSDGRTGTNLKKHSGYNAVGLDLAGHSSRYYIHMVRKLRLRLNDACRQISSGELRYAVYDTRTVLDETLRMLVNHADGTSGTKQSMVENLNYCESRHLIRGNREFFSKLHRIRIMCNSNEHRLDAEKNETGNKVCSAITMIHELLNRAEAVLVPA